MGLVSVQKGKIYGERRETRMHTAVHVQQVCEDGDVPKEGVCGGGGSVSG